MWNLRQRLVLGYLLLCTAVAVLGIYATLPRRIHALPLALACFVFAVIVAVAGTLGVLRPLRRAAAQARSYGGGRVEQRVEWSAADDLGVLATEFNRIAVRVRDLRESEAGRREMAHQLSDAVVQSIFEPVIVTDARGQLLKLNATAAQLLGEAAGDRMALTNTPGGERILSAVRDAVSMQRPVAEEGEAALLPLRIGQAERSFRLRTTPIRDTEGKLLGAVTVLEDVTELQDLDRFKTRFVAIASEKLRKPLESLRLSLYSLHRGFAGELRPLQAEIVSGAQDEAEQLNNLMSDLIDIAELDVGSRAIRLERLRPADILNDAAARIRGAAREKGVEVHVKAFSDLPLVQGDRRALRSVLENLLVNAVRYTPGGGSVLLEAIEQAGRMQFFVRDTGSGIEPARLPRVFGRFNAAQAEGTGLGLALVRRLIELLGGQVSVESRLGVGTTFSFTLPLASAFAGRHAIEIG